MVNAKCIVYDSLFNEDLTIHFEGSKNGAVIVRVADEIVDVLTVNDLDMCKMKSLITSIVDLSGDWKIKLLRVVEIH